MPLYENEHRKQCSSCGQIKSKETDFSNKISKLGEVRKHKDCDLCRQNRELFTMKKRDEARKIKDDKRRKEKSKHWTEKND